MMLHGGFFTRTTRFDFNATQANICSTTNWNYGDMSNEVSGQYRSTPFRTSMNLQAQPETIVREDYTPLVLDTGCSHCVTPYSEDFVGNFIQPCSLDSVQGLDSKARVSGVGMVEWIVRDCFGSVRKLKVHAYWVPSASIRLFSPQQYFQEQGEKGSLTITATHATLSLPRGETLTVPHNNGNNLPMMLLEDEVNWGGLSSSHIAALANDNPIANPFAVLSVVDDLNANLTAAQRHLLLWHWRLGHCDMKRVQSLFRSRQRADYQERSVLSSHYSIATAHHPKCAACLLAKQCRRSPSTPPPKFPPVEMKLKEGDLKPGDKVSIDQYVSAVGGRLPHTKGKEKEADKYQGGTIFVDHATGFIFIRHQISMRAGETVQAKNAFEKTARECGVSIRKYHADNFPFDAAEFQESLATAGQTLDKSGVGAHHQNGVAERAIKTVTSWARAMMLNALIHWPDREVTTLWPFALQHAVWIWNHLPKTDIRLSPMELFSNSKDPDNHSSLQRLHVWGCPVFVLDPRLQDGHKIPKWQPRSRRGQYLGISPNHSTTVGLILNPLTGNVSPQYHCVYDELFTTVPNADPGGLANQPPLFDQVTWERMLENGYERILDIADDNGNAIGQPELDAEWSNLEQQQQQQQQQPIFQPPLNPIIPSSALQPPQPPPPTAPEGPLLPPATPPHSPVDSIPRRRQPSPSPSPGRRVSFDPTVTAENPPVEPSAPEGAPSSGGAPSTSASTPEGAPPPAGAPDPVPTAVQPSPEPRRHQPFTTTRSGRPVRPPQRFRPDEVNYVQRLSTQKVRYGLMERERMASLAWERSLALLKNNQLKKLAQLHALSTDPDHDTLEDFHPMAFGAQQSDSDSPNYRQAMNGPLRNGFQQAMEKEIGTLNHKTCWEEVDREPWMHVIPSTWVFRIKRFTDGTIRKLKARFCVRGDLQKSGVDVFETFAPVVNWTTVRLMLILSALLRLQTVQVDYTAAFIHAPVGKPPGWELMSDEEKRRNSTYIEMPQGFTKPGRVLRLIKSLYGDRRSPRNFFLYLKEKLEKHGFVSQTAVDPCLFISDKVIVLVYVDDTLLFARDRSDIDDVLDKLRSEELELEVENEDVAGFLGVQIDYNEEDGSIRMTQPGLIKRIVEALHLEENDVRDTPASVKPLVADKNGERAHELYNYASVVGMMGYLRGHARPDIAHAVSQCARFTHAPRRSHELALERIGMYLNATKDKGIILRPSQLLHVDCYVDADFAGLWPHEDPDDPTSVKSRTGYVICVANCPVIWCSKLQSDIALSTMQAEYHSISIAMRDLLPFLDLLTVITSAVGLPEQDTTMKVTVHEDNEGALALAKLEPGRSTPRSKHYAVKYHWFREHIKDRGIILQKVDTKSQLADIFTKGLGKIAFRALRELLCGW